MTELFREANIPPEDDHISDGLITVEYRDGKTLTLQTAELRPSWTMEFGKKRHYHVLANSKGYELEPYDVVEVPLLQNFGDSLIETFSNEGTLALHSKRHVLDLGFQAIVGMEPAPFTGLLEDNIEARHLEDSDDFTLDLGMLIDEEGLDLWVRLEERQQFRDTSPQIVIARLALMSATVEDKVTMIPLVKTHNGAQIAPIPELLTFGDPWLYVGFEE